MPWGPTSLITWRVDPPDMLMKNLVAYDQAAQNFSRAPTPYFVEVHLS